MGFQYDFLTAFPFTGVDEVVFVPTEICQKREKLFKRRRRGDEVLLREALSPGFRGEIEYSGDQMLRLYNALAEFRRHLVVAIGIFANTLHNAECLVRELGDEAQFIQNVNTLVLPGNLEESTDIIPVDQILVCKLLNLPEQDFRLFTELHVDSFALSSIYMREEGETIVLELSSPVTSLLVWMETG